MKFKDFKVKRNTKVGDTSITSMWMKTVEVTTDRIDVEILTGIQYMRVTGRCSGQVEMSIREITINHLKKLVDILKKNILTKHKYIAMGFVPDEIESICKFLKIN